MNLSDSDKLEVLLKAFDFNVSEIIRKEDEQRQVFEWSTGLLLASFATVVAISGLTQPIVHSLLPKIIATCLVVIPITLFINRIVSRNKATIDNAIVVERVEELLHLFEDGFYCADSLFPKNWLSNLGPTIQKDNLPYYYVSIMAIMSGLVVLAIWAVL